MNNKIYPCLWFNNQAKEAADFYCKVFPNSFILSTNPMVTNFTLDSFHIMALNGGPAFSINPSISFFVHIKTEKELEEVYLKLMEGGSALMALDTYPWSRMYAWVKDKFGMTWQLMITENETNNMEMNTSFLFANKQYGKANEAIEFYINLFENSSINHIELYTENEAQETGTVKFCNFNLFNQNFSAMDGQGNHEFVFNEAVSIVVTCETQQEIDTYWEGLTKDGQESMCGWCKDKYGVSWQIVPSVLGELMSNPDKSQNVINAFLKMKKFDIETLMNV